MIFERVKEEVRAGRSISAAIATGYRKGLTAIIDANVVTIMVAFILFVLATAGVAGFALTLGIGTLVSFLTAVLFTQAILGTMGRSRILASPSALGAGNKQHEWTFDFMGASRWFFTMSGVILAIGAIGLGAKGLNFGIDFESGTRITTPRSSGPRRRTRSATSWPRTARPTPRSSGSTTRSSATTSSRSRPRSCSRTRCSR